MSPRLQLWYTYIIYIYIVSSVKYLRTLGLFERMNQYHLFGPQKKSSKPPKILTVPKKRPTADGNSETGFVKRIGLLNRKSVDLWWPEIGNSGCFSSFVGPPKKMSKYYTYITYIIIVIIPAYYFGRILRYNEMSLWYHSESLSHNTCVTWETQATTAKLVLSGGIWRENSEGAMVVSIFPMKLGEPRNCNQRFPTA